MKKYRTQQGDSAIIEAHNEIAQIWDDQETKLVRMPIYLKVGLGN